MYVARMVNRVRDIFYTYNLALNMNRTNFTRHYNVTAEILLAQLISNGISSINGQCVTQNASLSVRQPLVVDKGRFWGGLWL